MYAFVSFTVSFEKSIHFILGLLTKERGESAIFNEHQGIKVSPPLNPFGRQEVLDDGKRENA